MDKWDEIYERNRQRAIMDDVHKIAQHLEREALLEKMTPEEREAFYVSEKIKKDKEDSLSAIGCIVFVVVWIVLSILAIYFSLTNH